jgi:hypothetical protein
MTNNKPKEVTVMIEYISKNIDLLNLKLSREFYYNSIVFCVTDAIYSINANYESTKNTVIRYCKKNGLNRYWEYGFLPIGIEDEHTERDFRELVQGKSYQYFADSVFEKKQRTSSRSGILKAQAICEFADILHGNNING